MTEVGLIAARFVHYAALVLAFGAFAYASCGATSVSVSRRLRRLGFASSVLLLFAAGAVLAATVAGLGGGFAVLSDTTLWFAVIEDTAFGQVWSARLAMALLLIVLGIVVWRWPVRALTQLGFLVAGGLVVTVALTGHAAAGDGSFGLVHRAADAAHLVAAAVWIGSLPPLLFLLGREASNVREDLATASARLVAFHSVGLTAVAVLIVSGTVNSWFLVANPEALIKTTYGLVLLVKLWLFAVMIGFAAENRLRLVPALARDLSQGGKGDQSAAALRSRIRAELVVGMLILLAVSVLGVIEPASPGG